jgi:hypothetical protein
MSPRQVWIVAASVLLLSSACAPRACGRCSIRTRAEDTSDVEPEAVQEPTRPAGPLGKAKESIDSGEEDPDEDIQAYEDWQRAYEDFAKGYARLLLEGKTPEPLRLQGISTQGNVVVVKFLVLAPPLVLDARGVSDPNNYGFEVIVDGAPGPAVTSVALDGPDGVRITLASAPVGLNRRLRYGYARSQSGDDDGWSWAVQFDEPIP